MADYHRKATELSMSMAELLSTIPGVPEKSCMMMVKLYGMALDEAFAQGQVAGVKETRELIREANLRGIGQG